MKATAKDIDSLKKYIKNDVPEHFSFNVGKEAYPYYVDLSLNLPKKSLVSDLGTFEGLSALALSANDDVKVVSYDVSLGRNLVSGRKNIVFVEGDVFDYIDDILKSNIILVDLDPHDGKQEERFLDILVERKFKGVSVWDDVNLNGLMRGFWNNIDDRLTKEVLLDTGHYTGTGVIYHGKKRGG